MGVKKQSEVTDFNGEILLVEALTRAIKRLQLDILVNTETQIVVQWHSDQV